MFDAIAPRYDLSTGSSRCGWTTGGAAGPCRPSAWPPAPPCSTWPAGRATCAGSCATPGYRPVGVDRSAGMLAAAAHLGAPGAGRRPAPAAAPPGPSTAWCAASPCATSPLWRRSSPSAPGCVRPGGGWPCSRWPTPPAGRAAGRPRSASAGGAPRRRAALRPPPPTATCPSRWPTCRRPTMLAACWPSRVRRACPGTRLSGGIAQLVTGGCGREAPDQPDPPAGRRASRRSLSRLGPDGFAWLRYGCGFVTAGVAARIPIGPGAGRFERAAADVAGVLRNHRDRRRRGPARHRPPGRGSPALLRLGSGRTGGTRGGRRPQCRRIRPGSPKRDPRGAVAGVGGLPGERHVLLGQGAPGQGGVDGERAPGSGRHRRGPRPQGRPGPRSAAGSRQALRPPGAAGTPGPEPPDVLHLRRRRFRRRQPRAARAPRGRRGRVLPHGRHGGAGLDATRG